MISPSDAAADQMKEREVGSSRRARCWSRARRAAAELRNRSINVSCILPSIIDTPVNYAAMLNAGVAHRVVPETLDDVIVFLAAAGTCVIHGAALPVGCN